MADFVERFSVLRRKALNVYEAEVGKYRGRCNSFDIKRNELDAALLERAKSDRVLLFNTAADKSLRVRKNFAPPTTFGFVSSRRM